MLNRPQNDQKWSAALISPVEEISPKFNINFRPPDVKEFRMSRLFRFIVFSPTPLFLRAECVVLFFAGRFDIGGVSH